MRGRRVRPCADHARRCLIRLKVFSTAARVSADARSVWKKCSDRRRPAALLAVGRVADERLRGRRMERNEAGLAELAFPDSKHAGGQVDVVTRQTARLGQPQSGRDQQRKERDIGPRAKLVARRQEAGALAGWPRSRFRYTREAVCGAGGGPRDPSVGSPWPRRTAHSTARTGEAPTDVASLVPGRATGRPAPIAPRGRS